jgi:UDP-N-acetylglucosamine:LPS N-acetylglucosamine transferase
MDQTILEANQNIVEKTNIKIMFLSADNTGSGHRSITESLKHQLKNLEPNVEITVVDGFRLGGKLMTLIGNSYNFFAVNMPALWSFVYSLGEFMVRPAVLVFGAMIKKRLTKCIDEVRPDIIVSVHALFLGSVLNVIEKNNLDIPVIPIIADLDNVARLWADKRSSCTICPSIESKNKMLSAGLSEEKLKLTGFPVRSEFCDMQDKVSDKYELKDKLNFLIVSGSQGSRQILKTTNTLLKSENAFVTIIAGNNTILKSYLEKMLSPYIGTRVNILGFTKEMKKYMLEADILVVRASPNVLMEAINLNKPVIVTGSLMGQEAKNPDYVLKYNLGVVCKDMKKLPSIVDSLLAENGKKLKEIKSNQKNFIKKNAALEIAEIILDNYYESKGYEEAK